MSLLRQLSGALEEAIQWDQTAEHVPRWQALVDKVQDLDSVIYLPHKCHLAGCTGREHVCGQGEPIALVIGAAVQDLETDSPESVIATAIKQALGDIDISEQRKIIMKRLDDLQSAFNHHEALFSAIPRYTIQDLHWLVAVTRRTLQLYAKEAYNSFCHAHKQQQNYCFACLAVVLDRNYRKIALMLHKVADKPTLESLAALLADEPVFRSMLLKPLPTPSKPVDGGF